MLTEKGNNRGSLAVEVAILVAFVAFMALYAIPNRTIDAPESPTGLLPTRPIPRGIQTYEISGKFTGPQTTKLTVDPLDAKAGQTQNVSVDVSDVNPVSSVSVIVTLDNVSKANTTDLSLSEGTDTNGVWIGSLTFPDDTLDKNYTVTVVAVSTTGTSKIVTTIR